MTRSSTADGNLAGRAPILPAVAQAVDAPSGNVYDRLPIDDVEASYVQFRIPCRAGSTEANAAVASTVSPICATVSAEPGRQNALTMRGCFARGSSSHWHTSRMTNVTAISKH